MTLTINQAEYDTLCHPINADGGAVMISLCAFRIA